MMKIEELYVREEGLPASRTTVQIKVAPVSRLTSCSLSKISPKTQPAGSKLVRRHTISNMRLEQLNKHEEMSHIEDTEANEAILKNTLSKDELCRYLSPLKFLEIETWRREVPCGKDLDETEVEHKKWRTPVEILIPTAEREDDAGFSSSQEGPYGVNNNEASGRKKKAVSAYSRRRKFFEDVQRQNAEVLRRSNSDAAKLEKTRQQPRDALSAGEKLEARHRYQKQYYSAPRNQDTAESRLRTAYAPANGIPPLKETQTQKTNKNSGHIHKNHTAELPELPFTHVAIMTSYFAPGKLVNLSRIRGKTKPDPLRRNSIEHGDVNPQKYILLNSNTGSPHSSSQRISSSSWPTAVNQNHQRKLEKTGVQEEVQALPFNAMRSDTAGEQFFVGQYNAYQRNRGRTWNNRRTIESSFNAATKLYQNSVLPKKAHPARILGKIRASRTANGTREVSPKSQRRRNSLERENGENQVVENKDELPKTAQPSNGNVLSNHVTKISYAISRPQEGKFRSNHETSRVTSVPPINMKVSPAYSAANGLPRLSRSQEITSRNGLRYLNANGVIELSPIQNGNATTPWVAETFSPALGSNDGYFISQQRPNKTVTFRLGAG